MRLTVPAKDIKISAADFTLAISKLKETIHYLQLIILIHQSTGQVKKLNNQLLLLNLRSDRFKSLKRVLFSVGVTRK